MIVAMFTNNYLPHVSGVATSITRLERNLTRRGHTVHIFAPQFPGYTDTRPNVHRVQSLFIPSLLLPMPFPRTPGLAAAVDHVRPDIFHAHHPFLLGREALRLARNHGRPIVFTYHAMYEEYVHYVPFLPKAPLRAAVRRRALAFAMRVDAVIAPSESVAEILRERGVTTPIRVIPTGVNPAFFSRDASVRAQTRATWGVASDERAVVSFARLSDEKNFSLLLDAFARLRGRVRARLIIGGDGPAKKKLEALAETLEVRDVVQFVGHVPHEHVPSFLAGGDLFAYPSQSETQGLVTLEALAAGLPAVVVDAPGNRDLIQDGVNGVITAPTPSAMASALEGLVQDTAQRERLARETRRRAAEFSEERMAERVEQLYTALLPQR